MGQTRLNGLAALYIHKDIKLDFEKVIDEFGRKNRILKFQKMQKLTSEFILGR